jgi:hypothetical protein
MEYSRDAMDGIRAARKRARSRLAKAGPVTITRSDGTVVVQPAYRGNLSVAYPRRYRRSA